MINVIEMPKLSDTMEEGGISEWLKKEGERVEEGEPLLSIETDKATMEYASPEEGFLLKILEQKGAQLPLGVPIAILGDKGEKFNLEEILAGSKKEKEKKQEEPVKEEKKKTEAVERVEAPEETEQVTSLATNDSRIKASPLAKKIAKEKNINLSSVRGSGPHGRIVAFDVKSLREGSSFFVGSSFPSLVEKKIPLTQMRKTIAKRLVASKQGAPHFYLTVSACTEELSRWRKLLNAKEHIKVSLNDLLLFVCSRALTKHPNINAYWKEDSIVYQGAANLSIAVALPEGLITPVLRDCEKKNIWEIAQESKELVKRAKAKQLTPEDYTGGSFTLSNLGMTRVESFTAVINSPEVCILAIGRSEKKVVVKEDGSFGAEERMKLTLSCDHRAVDGYEGALFLETLLQFIENPLLLFSEI